MNFITDGMDPVRDGIGMEARDTFMLSVKAEKHQMENRVKKEVAILQTPKFCPKS